MDSTCRGAARFAGGRVVRHDGDPTANERDPWEHVRAYLEYRARKEEPPGVLVSQWDRFHAEQTPRIRAFLRRFRLSDADCEDCVQDVWSRFLSEVSERPYDVHRAGLASWLLTVARHRAIDLLRHRRLEARWSRVTTAIVDAEPGPDAAFERRSVQAVVRKALEELANHSPDLTYRVLYLRAIEGRPSAEVAEVLGLTPSQVRFRLHRMMIKFRKILESSAGVSQHHVDREQRPTDQKPPARATPDAIVRTIGSREPRRGLIASQE